MSSFDKIHTALHNTSAGKAIDQFKKNPKKGVKQIAWALSLA